MAFLLSAYASVFAVLAAYWLWLGRRRKRLLGVLARAQRPG
jgi:uncharacterized iron-regulated membrane protein